jgi:hypothetical protein
MARSGDSCWRLPTECAATPACVLPLTLASSSRMWRFLFVERRTCKLSVLAGLFPVVSIFRELETLGVKAQPAKTAPSELTLKRGGSR